MYVLYAYPKDSTLPDITGCCQASMLGPYAEMCAGVWAEPRLCSSLSTAGTMTRGWGEEEVYAVAGGSHFSHPLTGTPFPFLDWLWVTDAKGESSLVNLINWPWNVVFIAA